MKTCKIILYAILMLLVPALNNLFAQSMYVRTTSQVTTSYLLSSIGNITFSAGNMVLKLKSNSVVTWPVTTVKDFNFSPQALALPVEPVTDFKNSVKIYPNPGNGTVNVSYVLHQPGLVQIDVIGLDGRLLQHTESRVSTLGTNTIQLPESGLVAGTYQCRVQTADYTSTQKLIINK